MLGLANRALLQAGAQSSTGQKDYVWGKPVTLQVVIPGDILQSPLEPQTCHDDGVSQCERRCWQVAPREGRRDHDDYGHRHRQDQCLQAPEKTVTANLRNLVVCVGLSTLACGHAPMSPVPQPDTERPSVAKPLLSNCVLHAGQSDTTIRQDKMPGGKLGPPTWRVAMVIAPAASSHDFRPARSWTGRSMPPALPPIERSNSCEMSV